MVHPSGIVPPRKRKILVYAHDTAAAKILVERERTPEKLLLIRSAPAFEAYGVNDREVCDEVWNLDNSPTVNLAYVEKVKRSSWAPLAPTPPPDQPPIVAQPPSPPPPPPPPPMVEVVPVAEQVRTPFVRPRPFQSPPPSSAKSKVEKAE